MATTTISYSLVEVTWANYTSQYPWDEEVELKQRLSTDATAQITTEGRTGLEYVKFLEETSVTFNSEEYDVYFERLKELQKSTLYKWVVSPTNGVFQAKRILEADVALAWKLYHHQFFENTQLSQEIRSVLQVKVPELLEKARTMSEETGRSFTLYLKTTKVEAPAVDE